MKINHSSGFTLIEIMVVVVIIGLLATLILPNVLGRQDQALVTKAKADINAITGQLALYKLDNFTYPATATGLAALVSNVENKNTWRGYLDKLPKDPWGNDYLYKSPGEHSEDFDLWSNGADGEEGGEDTKADIGNWQ